MNKYRSHNCSELTDRDTGKTVNLSGWLHRKRDHGNLLFIDLRDHYGITQCVVENNNKNFSLLEKLRPESVILVLGKVVKREKGTEREFFFSREKVTTVSLIQRSLSEANLLRSFVFKTVLRVSKPIDIKSLRL